MIWRSVRERAAGGNLGTRPTLDLKPQSQIPFGWSHPKPQSQTPIGFPVERSISLRVVSRSTSSATRRRSAASSTGCAVIVLVATAASSRRMRPRKEKRGMVIASGSGLSVKRDSELQKLGAGWSGVDSLHDLATRKSRVRQRDASPHEHETRGARFSPAPKAIQLVRNDGSDRPAGLTDETRFYIVAT